MALRPGPLKKSVPPVTISVSFNPRLLSISAAALYLGGVTEWYVEEELIRSGQVQYRWLGNQRVIERSDLDQWVRKQPKLRGKMEAPQIVGKKSAA